MVWRRLRTEQLINVLAADLRPLSLEKRIRMRRLWFGAASGMLILWLPFAQPLRADIGSRSTDALFVVTVTTSLIISILGMLTLNRLRAPHRSLFWLYVPAIAFGAWTFAEFINMAADVLRQGGSALAFERSPQCPLIIAVVGTPVSLVILSLNRNAVLLWRGPSIAIAALSAFSLPATALNLFHSLDNAAMVLLWHFSAITAFSIATTFLVYRRRPRLLFDWLAL